MSITWDESLTTGVEMIDEQHKELFSRFDRLLAACRQGQGKAEVLNLLGFLHEYVVEHFQAEEELMATRNYAGLSSHREQHRLFREQLAGLQQRAQSDGVGIDLLAKTNNTMLDWIIQHVRQIDKQIGQGGATKGD